MQKHKVLVVLVVILLVIFGMLAFFRSDDTKTLDAIAQAQPTNFVQAGILSFATSTAQDIMYLSYTSNENAPTTSMELPLDALSMCVTSNGAIPCLEMNILFHIPFDGKQAVVEGIEKEARLVVRKIRVFEEGEVAGIVARPGLTYISWEQATELIKNCQVQQVTQSHDFMVDLQLLNDKNVVAVERQLDEVFTTVASAKNKCGDIAVGTK